MIFWSPHGWVCLAARAADCKSVTQKQRRFESCPIHFPFACSRGLWCRPLRKVCGNAPKVQILPQTLLTKGGIFRKHNTSVHSAAEFYRQFCVKLGLEASQKKTVMFQRVQEYFYSMSTNKNVHCMVCLDEAQYLNSDILRDLKMLCNFCMDSKNCFSLILLGQPVLTSLMMRQPNEALRRRIAVSYGFAGFSICPKQTLGIVPKRYTNPTFTCF